MFSNTFVSAEDLTLGLLATLEQTAPEAPFLATSSALEQLPV